MDDETLKLRCLELALEKSANVSEALKEAERMFAHIKGRSDPHAPTPKARIVGTEGHLEPPFDDYVKE